MSFFTGAANLGSRLKTSAANLYRAIPRDRKSLVSLHKKKVALIKEAGILGLSQDGLRTVLSLLDAGRTLFFSHRSFPAFIVDSQNITESYAPLPLLKYLPTPLVTEMLTYLPQIRFPHTLVDKKNGYICYMLPINAENMTKVEMARTVVANALRNFGYEGWSDQIDRRYDTHSFYYIVEDSNGDIIATARVTHKTADSSFPLENALKTEGSQNSLEAEGLDIMEINSFCYQKGHGKAVLSLFPALGRHASLTGVKKIFCLLDEENTKAKKLYLMAGFKPSRRYNERIYYPTFGRTRRGQFSPTFWRIMEMDQLRFSLYCAKAIKYPPA